MRDGILGHLATNSQLCAEGGLLDNGHLALLGDELISVDMVKTPRWANQRDALLFQNVKNCPPSLP
jgi:hypothetical protein